MSEEWSVGLTQDGLTTYHRFTASNVGTTLHDVAVGLALALNQNTGPEFIAGVRGDSDTLVVTNINGATFTVSLAITPMGAVDATIDPGSGRLGRDGAYFTYCDIDSITDSSAATNRIFAGTNRDDDIRLGVTGNGQLKVESEAGVFIPVTFQKPAGSLTIKGDSGNDTVSFGDVGLSFALVIDGGAGTDTIFYEIQADAGSRNIPFGSSSVGMNGTTLFTYSNTESAENPIINGTTAADHIVLAPAGSGYYSIKSDTFGTITFNDPGTDRSIRSTAARATIRSTPRRSPVLPPALP